MVNRTTLRARAHRRHPIRFAKAGQSANLLTQREIMGGCSVART